MKRTPRAAAVAVVFSLFALSCSHANGPADEPSVDGETVDVAPDPPPAAAPEVSADAFVGPSACKACHFKQDRYWTRTRLAKAMDVLAPTPVEDTELAARKSAARLDPTKDYSSREDCLGCHTTGFGAEGGYPREPAESEADRKRTAEMGSVSCEACHGAGARYVAYKEARLRIDERARFTREELVEQGLVIPTRELCLTCHQGGSPTAATDPFDFERDKELVHSKHKR